MMNNNKRLRTNRTHNSNQFRKTLNTNKGQAVFNMATEMEELERKRKREGRAYLPFLKGLGIVPWNNRNRVINGQHSITC